MTNALANGGTDLIWTNLSIKAQLSYERYVAILSTWLPHRSLHGWIIQARQAPYTLLMLPLMAGIHDIMWYHLTPNDLYTRLRNAQCNYVYLTQAINVMGTLFHYPWAYSGWVWYKSVVIQYSSIFYARKWVIFKQTKTFSSGDILMAEGRMLIPSIGSAYKKLY